MNYESAIVLKRRGLVPRDQEFYIPHLWRKYDLGMFLENLEADHDTIDYKRLFDLIKCKISLNVTLCVFRTTRRVAE